MFPWRGEDSVVWQRREGEREKEGTLFPCSPFSCLMDLCMNHEKLAENSTQELELRLGGILSARCAQQEGYGDRGGQGYSQNLTLRNHYGFCRKKGSLSVQSLEPTSVAPPLLYLVQEFLSPYDTSTRWLPQGLRARSFHILI